MDEETKSSPDIHGAAELMGAADSAAYIIKDLLTGDLAVFIDELVAAGTIKRMEGAAWKARLKSVGNSVVSELLGLHDKMTRRAIELEIDPGEPSPGKAILMAKVEALDDASTRSGDR